MLVPAQHADHLGSDEELVAVEPSGHRDQESLVFRPRTVGALDMGGASMQAAMEITTNLQLEGMTDKDKSQVAEINLGCKEHDTEHTYRIFVTTFLGFGANEAMARHQRQHFSVHLRNGSSCWVVAGRRSYLQRSLYQKLQNHH